MNAKNYRTEYDLSAIDFPAIEGPVESRIDFTTEVPFIVNNKVKLKITKKYFLVEFYNVEEHEVLTAVSVYEIPVTEIKIKEYIYECFKDAKLGLSEAYEYAKKTIATSRYKFSNSAN